MLTNSGSEQLRLRTAVVLMAGEVECTVACGGSTSEVQFADFFPRPRLDRVAPGNLVAIDTSADAGDRIVWRWFDAVVVGQDDGVVTLWEQFHGVVQAHPRDPQLRYVPGSRVYASSGLPGAEWWAAGPAVLRPEDADVELPEVEAFLRSIGVRRRT